MWLSYVGQVRVEDLQRGLSDMPQLLADLPADFRVLADLSRLDSIDLGCVEQIGATMELFEQHGVGLVVRLIPDPAKDIGFNIISAFHYKNRPRTATCETLAEAMRLLSL